MQARSSVYKTASVAEGSQSRSRSLVAIALIVLAPILFVGPASGQDETTTSQEGETETTDDADSTTTSVDEQEKQETLANLDLARAADQEIANDLRAITEAANQTVEKIQLAEDRIEAAIIVEERNRQKLAESEDEQSAVQQQLAEKAVQSFQNEALFEENFITTGDAEMIDGVRREALLDITNQSTTELLLELSVIVEQQEIAKREAEEARRQAEEAKRVLEAEQAVLQEQLDEQKVLKAEAERRVDLWAGEAAVYAKEDEAVQQVIRESQPETVDTSVKNPGLASEFGFQWPVEGTPTSEFGYRIHPVYGTRRLHAGIDVGAPNGTSVWAAGDGTVIFSGVQGGYGNTVIIDHGNNVTTLYAHNSSLNVSKGDTVERGDVVALVGSTGTSTGNHLHFEVRVSGTPTNPREYLPAA